MYDQQWFKNKRVTIMGLGLHGGGLGVAKWLLRHGARLTITDTQSADALAPTLRQLERYVATLRQRGLDAVPPRLVLGRHDRQDFSSTDLVIRNPAVPREHELLALAAGRGIPVETDVSLFCLMCPFPITAVTGTKGKTTVTTMLWQLAAHDDRRTVVGGNIRISPFDALDRIITESGKKRPRPMPIILELSSWQLESLEAHRFSPHVAIVTNVLPDHLNRYRDMADYAAAKELNVRFQKAGDVAVMNADDARVRKMGERAEKRGAEVLWFTPRRVPTNGCGVRNGRVVFRRADRETTVATTSDLKLIGDHNLYNVLAAVAAALVMGLPLATLRRSVKNFSGAPGRLEVVGQRSGVTFVNDTTATMPDASAAAVRAWAGCVSGRVILLAGGADKNLRFAEWGKIVARHVGKLVLFDGTARPKIEAALKSAKSRVPTVVVKSMAEALRVARQDAKSGDVVLLSPACASFGIFKNEFDRGEQFVKLVKNINSKMKTKK